MNLGIVILNWNGESLLKKFFPSIVKFTSEQHNLYLIDNGSSDNSVAFIERNYKRVKVIKLDKNYGYAKGYNLGLKEIKEEIICLLNNDVEVTENWTDNILKQFKSEPNTAVIQPKLKNYHNKSMFDYSGGAGGFLDKYGYPYAIEITFINVKRLKYEKKINSKNYPISGLDFLSAISGAATSISNVGPGLGEMIGPNGNFSQVSDMSKWILSFAMLLGRLEIFAVLVLFLPSFWRS